MTTPGMKNVALMRYFASSARMRRTPIAPNSPREIGVGDVRPQAIMPLMASKSKVRQAMWRGMTHP